MKIYKVGGAIRDKLLGLSPKDNDYVVVGATIEEMLAMGYIPIGRDFPVFLHPITKEEYALARTEKKSGIGYKNFKFYTNKNVTLFEDLKRRDITINAIAEDNEGNLYDPFGGIKDLEHKIIHHISKAFNEDPLRVIRVARFSAKYDFNIAHDTLALMKQISRTPNELESISTERIYIELNKIIANDYLTFFNILNECNALDKIFSEFKVIITNNNLYKLLETKWYNNKRINNLDNNYKIVLLLLIINIFTNQQLIPKYINNKHYSNILIKTLDAYNIMNQINNLSNIEDITKLYMKIITKIGSHSQTNNLSIIFLLITILNDCFKSNLDIIISNLQIIINTINNTDYENILITEKNTNIKEIIYNYKIKIIKNILEK